jgi:hypothetical protein
MAFGHWPYALASKLTHIAEVPAEATNTMAHCRESDSNAPANWPLEPAGYAGGSAPCR